MIVMMSLCNFNNTAASATAANKERDPVNETFAQAVNFSTQRPSPSSCWMEGAWSQTQEQVIVTSCANFDVKARGYIWEVAKGFPDLAESAGE